MCPNRIRGRFILPCVLDDTSLPQYFEHSVHVDLRRDREATIARLVKAVRGARIGANPLSHAVRAESTELHDAIQAIAAGQRLVTDALGKREIGKAEEAQAMLDGSMPKALARWPLDPMIVKLDGYHIKNGYMVRHWNAVQSGRGPADPALERAERRFFEALWLDPLDPEGLEGIGSVRFLRRDLHAAAFLFRCAIRQAERRGFRYEAAEANLKAVRQFLGERAGSKG